MLAGEEVVAEEEKEEEEKEEKETVASRCEANAIASQPAQLVPSGASTSPLESSKAGDRALERSPLEELGTHTQTTVAGPLGTRSKGLPLRKAFYVAVQRDAAIQEQRLRLPIIGEEQVLRLGAFEGGLQVGWSGNHGNYWPK